MAGGIPRTIAKETRLTVMRALRVPGAIWWAAPYSTAFSCTLPPGSTLRCIAGVTLDEPDVLIEAMPEADVEALLVPKEDRLASKYRGYTLYLKASGLGADYEPTPHGAPVMTSEEFAAALKRTDDDYETLRDRYRGVMLGTAVGDSVGLPAEGIPRARMARLFPGPWKQRLLPGIGMLSDDTEHAAMVAHALLSNPHDPAAFARDLGSQIKGWAMSLPAGIGLATLKSALKLMVGFGPARSGVYSAGNAPAMRGGPMGAFFHNAPDLLEPHVRASTVLSHTDPRALTGALAVARLIALTIPRPAAKGPPSAETVAGVLRSCAIEADAEWDGIVARMSGAWAQGMSVEAFADSIGLERGVSGYVYATVPVAVYAWLRHWGDFRRTLESVFALGGDTDTVGAVTGALAGASVGLGGIPREWAGRIVDCPEGRRALVRLADALFTQSVWSEPPARRLRRPLWSLRLARNMVFLCIVLAHGFRRLLPPY